MKKLYLTRIATFNTGVIGVLRVEGIEIMTIESHDMVKAGTYPVKMVDGRWLLNGKYPVMMDSNCKYRNPGLVVGMGWRMDRFDVDRKGDALEILYPLFQEGVEVVITNTKTDIGKKLAEQADAHKQESQEFQDRLEVEIDSQAELIKGLSAEISELKATIKHLLNRQTDIKPATMDEARQVIEKLESENESDADGSSAPVPAGE